MNRSTAFILILLRLAIGWHFLFEGWHKLHTHLAGPTESVAGRTRPWSSEGYFREGPGPLARVVRHRVGDPDDEALGRLEVAPLPAGQDPVTYPPRKRVPPLLDAEWQAYLNRFASHYRLDESQQAEAKVRLEQVEDRVVGWLTRTEVDATTKAVKKKYQSVSYEQKRSVPVRVAEYRARVVEVRDLVGKKMPLFGKDVEGRHLGQAKAELAELRSGLLEELNEQFTRKFHQALDELLTPEQLAAEKMIPEAESAALLSWLDLVTAWGLTVLGGCLLLGLLTRTSCVLAAAFLVMTYLSTPPWPWMPTSPKDEGFYLFVNKNAVELLALLALATTASGRWFGVDALLHELRQAIFGRPRAKRA
jgi:uncharacterized membrane protein YphA (DoxX/SURF4 family)